MHRTTLLRQVGLVPLPDPELRHQGVPLEQMRSRRHSLSRADTRQHAQPPHANDPGFGC
jgi:hypothetical protein